MDKLGGNISIADYLTDFRSSFGLIDCWRKLHPRSRELSWFNSHFSIGSRLDKFFVSKNLRSNLLSSSISPCCLSDHDLLDLHFQLVNVPTSGPGIWKFNASLLRDSGFNDLISSRISELAEAIDSFADARKWWGFYKNSLKAEIVAFSKEKRIRASHSRVVLTNRLIPLNQRLASGDNSVKAEIASLELELKLLVSVELEGSKIRSRSRWFEREVRNPLVFSSSSRGSALRVVLFPRSWILTMSRFLLVRRLNRLMFLFILAFFRRILLMRLVKNVV